MERITIICRRIRKTYNEWRRIKDPQNLQFMKNIRKMYFVEVVVGQYQCYWQYRWHVLTNVLITQVMSLIKSVNYIVITYNIKLSLLWCLRTIENCLSLKVIVACGAKFMIFFTCGAQIVQYQLCQKIGMTLEVELDLVISHFVKLYKFVFLT